MIFKVPPLTDSIWRLHEEIEELRTKLTYGSTLRRWTGFLARVMLARAIQGSNSIEGYNVTIDDAMAAADGESPMDMSPEQETWAAITGYRDAMTYVLRLADDPHFEHSASLIRSLHFMIQKYDGTKHPGQWRRGPIYVRNDSTGETVYEGPYADLVPELIGEFVESLRTPSPDVPVMVRAAMAHLNLVMIHPFADGNGRMGRCLQTMVLVREGIMTPQFCSIEEQLGRYRQEYYDILAKVGEGAWHPERDATAWVEFCLTIHHRQATTLLKRTRDLARLWEALEETIAEHDLPDRVAPALADAALGFKVRNASYRAQADISGTMASQDFVRLVNAGLLEATGGKTRARFYVATEKLRRIRAAARDHTAAAQIAAPQPQADGQLPLFWEDG